MSNFKPMKITYTFSQPLQNVHRWSDDGLNRLLNELTTDLILTGMDLQEVDVENSNNKDAIKMLKEIGIES
jgi:hypothetical protein